MHIDRLELGKSVLQNDFDKAVSKNFQRLMDQLCQILNNGLIFSDNLESTISSVTTGGAGTELAIPHTLKRVPSGYLVLSRDQAGIVYDGSTAWTTSNIYIKANVATLKLKIMTF